MPRIRTYSVNLKKLVRVTYKFLRFVDVKKHWSKNNNERFDVHTAIVFGVLFCIADRPYRRFVKLVEPSVKELFGLETVPAFSTLWYAWRRVPPRLWRQLVQLSGKGGRDRAAAIDPTHFQITRPSVAYCKRIKRKLEREPNRKVSIVTGTRSLLILDVIMRKYHRRSGLDDIPLLMKEWVKGKTVLYDTEGDAEERFHQAVLNAGGKGVAPLRHKGVPVWRTKGSRRKQLRRKWPGRSYRRRTLAETANSMLKRGMGETLRGSTVGQQARHLYMKCFTHNMLLRTCRKL